MLPMHARCWMVVGVGIATAGPIAARVLALTFTQLEFIIGNILEICRILSVVD